MILAVHGSDHKKSNIINVYRRDSRGAKSRM